MTWPRLALVPVLVRLSVLLSGVVVLIVPRVLHGAPALITVIGVLLAVVAPARVGATVATAGFVIAWTTAYGWHLSPTPLRTITAAAALYALHTTASLAAFIPLDAQVEASVLRRYVLRCVPAVIGAAVIIGVSYAIPRTGGSALVELAGLLGVLAVIAIPTWLLCRTDERASQTAAPAQR